VFEKSTQLTKRLYYVDINANCHAQHIAQMWTIRLSAVQLLHCVVFPYYRNDPQSPIAFRWNLILYLAGGSHHIGILV